MWLHQYGKGPEVFGGLDLPPTFHSHFLTSLLHLCCTVLCSSPEARTRMLVPGKWCPTSVWPLLQTHPVLSHSVLMQTVLGCCHQQSLFGSIAIHPAVLFVTWTLATLPSRLLQKLMLQVLPLVWRYRISCLLPSWGRGLILALLPCYLLDGITSLRWPPKAVV